jgi:hypothetical protein
MIKSAMSKTPSSFGILNFGTWFLFGIWVLGFVISRPGDLGFQT